MAAETALIKYFESKETLNIDLITLPVLKEVLVKYLHFWVKKSREKDGYVYCYTCGKPMVIGTHDCQAGHWLPKGGFRIHKFNPDNIRPQCGSQCNLAKAGDYEVFKNNLIKEIGSEKVEEMYVTRNQSSKKPKIWYIDKIEHYWKLRKEI